MKAATVRSSDGSGMLRYEEVADPQCARNGVLIKVEAISLEGGDFKARTNPREARPHIIGYAAAGHIVQVGEDVRELTVGQRVATFDFAGSHAEMRAVPAEFCWPIPERLSTQAAACIPVAFGTAHDCLFEYGHLRPGETAFIQGGAGGVGLAAIQLAKRAGARVIATASTQEKLDQLRDYGLDAGINYQREHVFESVMKLTDGRGADVVIDPIGSATLQSSILSLAEGGRVMMVGRARGGPPRIVNVETMTRKRNSLIGVFFGAEIGSARVRSMMASLFQRTARDELRVVISKTFALADAAAAHGYAETSDRPIGRVLLVP